MIRIVRNIKYGKCDNYKLLHHQLNSIAETCWKRTIELVTKYHHKIIKLSDDLMSKYTGTEEEIRIYYDEYNKIFNNISR